MSSINIRKIAVLLLTIVALAHLDKILAVLSSVYEFFRDSLSPFRNSSAEGRFAVAVGMLALAYVTIFRLLHDRDKK
jgi:hypothetical protein